MSACYLYTLPNELLLYLFSPLPTTQLLPLTVISQRIYTIILRILHNRLVAASKLHSHTLLLECYHPSAKLTEPAYFCTYHGTDGLSLYEEVSLGQNNVGRLGEMRKMYSRFRPYRRDLEPGGRKVAPRPGDIPGSRTFPGTVQDGFQGETVKQTLGLEAHELFTQLIAQTNLVKISPRHGLYTSFVDVEEGVVRVWRNWLRETAARGPRADTEVETALFGQERMGKEAKKEVALNKVDLDDSRILWASPLKNTGIRFNVMERKLRRDTPVLIRTDEDMPVSYEVEFDELFIRTSHLLFMLEQSMLQDDNSSGKAAVFGSFG